MRKKIFLVVLLYNLVCAAHIKEFKTFSQHTTNDIFLIFQSPLKQTLKLSYHADKKVYSIAKLSNHRIFSKNFTQGPLKSILLDAKANTLYIKPTANVPYKIQMALSHDKKILRLRFVSQTQIIKNKYEDPIKITSWQYIVVLFIVVCLIIILFIFQNKIKKDTILQKISHLRYYPIDTKSRIISLVIHEKNYIIFEGSKGCVLLDCFELNDNKKIQKNNE